MTFSSATFLSNHNIAKMVVCSKKLYQKY